MSIKQIRKLDTLTNQRPRTAGGWRDRVWPDCCLQEGESHCYGRGGGGVWAVVSRSWRLKSRENWS